MNQRQRLVPQVASRRNVVEEEIWTHAHRGEKKQQPPSLSEPDARGKEERLLLSLLLLALRRGPRYSLLRTRQLLLKLRDVGRHGWHGRAQELGEVLDGYSTVGVRPHFREQLLHLRLGHLLAKRGQ